MPNIVENELTVSGNEESIGQFKKLMGGAKNFSLEKILPTPQKLLDDNPTYQTKEDMDENYPPEWYTWRMQHWGVKWDISDCELITDSFETPSDHFISYKFTSAWNPPLIALERLSKEIPELKIELDYSEPMNEVFGHCVMKNGEADFKFS